MNAMGMMLKSAGIDPEVITGYVRQAIENLERMDKNMQLILEQQQEILHRLTDRSNVAYIEHKGKVNSHDRPKGSG